MTRAQEIAQPFLADESFSRDVEHLAEAVDAASVEVVPAAEV
jgi:hypothetical protein